MKEQSSLFRDHKLAIQLFQHNPKLLNNFNQSHYNSLKSKLINIDKLRTSLSVPVSQPLYATSWPSNMISRSTEEMFAFVFVSSADSCIWSSTPTTRSTISALCALLSLLGSSVSLCSIWVFFLSSASVLSSSTSIPQEKRSKFLSSGRASSLTSGWPSSHSFSPFLQLFFSGSLSVLLVS